MASHLLLTLESLLICICVCVPCIHQQRDCGRVDIPIWRNVSHVSLLGDLRVKEKKKSGGRQMKRGQGWNIGEEHLIQCKLLGVFVPLTQWVAPRCGTLHVEVVALVEAPSFGPVRKVVGGGLFERQLFGQSLVLLLGNYNIVAGRHEVVAGAGNFDVRLWGWGVACRGARRGLVAVCPLLQVCRANRDKEVSLINLWFVYLTKRGKSKRAHISNYFFTKR